MRDMTAILYVYVIFSGGEHEPGANGNWKQRLQPDVCIVRVG